MLMSDGGPSTACLSSIRVSMIHPIAFIQHHPAHESWRRLGEFSAQAPRAKELPQAKRRSFSEDNVKDKLLAERGTGEWDSYESEAKPYKKAIILPPKKQYSR